MDSQQINKHIIQALTDFLSSCEPTTLLYCAKEPVPALDKMQTDIDVYHLNQSNQLESLQRFDVGVVFDFLEHLNEKAGITLLAKLRNLHCDRLWVAVPEMNGWNFKTMIGLGFRRVACYETSESILGIYVYDLANYNRKREWNNPKFWANPENWGKYRW
ncbi:MAG: DUF6231 family protein [Pseudomonadales bacterium]|nr:DUF6231 family protein [Pseudomonadales bacterium]